MNNLSGITVLGERIIDERKIESLMELCRVRKGVNQCIKMS